MGEFVWVALSAGLVTGWVIGAALRAFGGR